MRKFIILVLISVGFISCSQMNTSDDYNDCNDNRENSWRFSEFEEYVMLPNVSFEYYQNQDESVFEQLLNITKSNCDFACLLHGDLNSTIFEDIKIINRTKPNIASNIGTLRNELAAAIECHNKNYVSIIIFDLDSGYCYDLQNVGTNKNNVNIWIYSQGPFTEDEFNLWFEYNKSNIIRWR